MTRDEARQIKLALPRPSCSRASARDKAYVRYSTFHRRKKASTGPHPLPGRTVRR
jgi:hypothetical protein